MQSLKGDKKQLESDLFFNRKSQWSLTLFRMGLLRVAQLGGGGARSATYNSKTINDNEMKLGGVVKDH